MIMIIFDMQWHEICSVMMILFFGLWSVFEVFLSPLDENDHFCHRICLMLMILFFLVLKPPEWSRSFLACISLHDFATFFWGLWSHLNEGDHFWHAFCLVMVILFFWFLSDLNEDDHFSGMHWAQWWRYFFLVFKPPQWRWSFLACSLLHDGDTFFWFLSDLNEDDHFLSPFDENDHFWHGIYPKRWFTWGFLCDFLRFCMVISRVF